MGTCQAVLCRCMGMVVPVSSGRISFWVPAPSLLFRWSLVQVYKGWLCHLHGLQWQQTSPLQGEFSLAAAEAEQLADKAQPWYCNRPIDVS